MRRGMFPWILLLTTWILCVGAGGDGIVMPGSIHTPNSCALPWAAVANVERPSEIILALPSDADLHGMTDCERSFRYWFYVGIYLAAFGMFGVVLDLVRCCADSFVTESGSHAFRASQGPVTEFDSADVRFVWYHVSYTYACAALALFAVHLGLVNEGFGLDFELYVPFCAEAMVVHLVCAIVRLRKNHIEHTRSPSFFCKVMLSTFPIISERWNLLKDFLMADIYILSLKTATSLPNVVVAWVCICIIAGSILYSTLQLHGDPAILRSLRKGDYWMLTETVKAGRRQVTPGGTAYEPVELHDVHVDQHDRTPRSPLISETQVANKSRLQSIWLEVLRALDKSTRGQKRVITKYREIPQTIAALLFTVSDRIAIFVVAMLIVSVFKMLLQFVARPYILCLLAAADQPWENMTAQDVTRTMEHKRFATWQKRYRAARAIVTDKLEPPLVIAAAMRALGKLFKGEEDNGDEWELYKNSLVEQLRKSLQNENRSEMKQAILSTLMDLCPGLKENDFKTSPPKNAGNLGYVAAGPSVEKFGRLVQNMRQGDDMWELLRDANELRHSSLLDGSTTDTGALMVVITDLEPDDAMGIAELWQWKAEQKGHIELIVVFCASFAHKDSGTVFEKKMLMGALMLGVREIYVLTPHPQYKPISGEVRDTSVTHPLGASMAEKREGTLDRVCEQIASFKGEDIYLYIMAPCRGNLGAILAKLKNNQMWQSAHKKWDIAMYSGAFNMRNMDTTDVDALREIAKVSGLLVDIAKFPFFGFDDCDESTESFTTFAPSKFAANLSREAPPLLVAALKSFNDEHNGNLVAPNEKLFKENGESLTPQEKRRWAKIKDMYQKDKDLVKYCKALINDFTLFVKIKNFKKSTVSAFAHDSCDSPLCDQLVFLHELLQSRLPAALKQDTTGKWDLDMKKGHTKIAPWVEDPASVRALQPALMMSKDQTVLNYAKDALQEYLMKHLESLKEVR